MREVSGCEGEMGSKEMGIGMRFPGGARERWARGKRRIGPGNEREMVARGAGIEGEGSRAPWV